MNQENSGWVVSMRWNQNASISIFILLFLAGVAGCAHIQNRIPTEIGSSEKLKNKAQNVSIGDRAQSATQSARVSNPRAQEIRFDGQEQLLGGGSCKALPASDLLKQVVELQEKKRLRSAATLIQLHKRSARKLILDQGERGHAQTMKMIAALLDEGMPSNVWHQLQSEFDTSADKTAQWQAAVKELARAGADIDKAESAMRELNTIAKDFESPMLRIQTLRLNGEFQIAAGRTVEAIDSLVTAAELAAGEGAPSLASDLWLMSCEASLRLDEVDQARQCWKAAVHSQLASIHARGSSQPLPTMDPVFWEQAVRLAHPGDDLPKELTLALSPWYSRIGIRANDALAPETALWSAIAEYQLATGQPHLASLAIKRAETKSSENEQPYLQIMLARAMAAQQQQAVAMTILGTVAETDSPDIRAAALAVMGSIKVQSGAYEQGGKFLGQALAIDGAENWPGRLAAQADLANVQLILGKLDEALPSLHAVQNEMLMHEKWQSLCQSLENEAAVLEIDGRKKEAKQIRQRIAQIETRRS